MSRGFYPVSPDASKKTIGHPRSERPNWVDKRRSGTGHLRSEAACRSVYEVRGDSVTTREQCSPGIEASIGYIAGLATKHGCASILKNNKKAETLTLHPTQVVLVCFWSLRPHQSFALSVRSHGLCKLNLTSGSNRSLRSLGRAEVRPLTKGYAAWKRLRMHKESHSNNWKLDLRYGRLVTPYKHFTAIADGIVGQLVDGFECRPGPAVMTMKTWATDTAESGNMIRSIGEQIGFLATGKIEIYETDAERPPSENPHGYDITFVPYGPG